MRGSPLFRFRASSRLATRRNPNYILRPTTDGHPGIDPLEQVWTRGVPTWVMEGAETAELRRFRLVAWAEQQEEEARMSVSPARQGRARTHCRIIASFPEWHGALADQIRPMIDSWIDVALPPGVNVIAAIHWDKSNLHVHLWVSTLLEDGSRLELDRLRFRSLDEHWNRIYCKASGMDPEVHRMKKAETFEYQTLYRGALREDRAAGRTRSNAEIENWILDTYELTRPLRFNRYRDADPSPIPPAVADAAAEAERLAIAVRAQGFRTRDLDAWSPSQGVFEFVRSLSPENHEAWDTLNRFIGPSLWNRVQAIRYGGPELVPADVRYDYPDGISERLQEVVDLLETRHEPTVTRAHQSEADRFLTAGGRVGQAEWGPTIDGGSDSFQEMYLSGWVDPERARHRLVTFMSHATPESIVDWVIRDPEAVGSRKDTPLVHPTGFREAVIEYLRARRAFLLEIKEARVRIAESQNGAQIAVRVRNLVRADRVRLESYIASRPALVVVWDAVEKEALRFERRWARTLELGSPGISR
jgi:hypothetical protein